MTSAQRKIEQKGGGVFWQAFKALLWTLLISVMVALMFSWVAIRFLKNVPVIGSLISFGCMMSNQGWFDIILALLDLLLLIPPLFPLAAGILLTNKAYKAFTVMCLVTGLTPWTFGDLMWKIIDLIPFGGVFGKVIGLVTG